MGKKGDNFSGLVETKFSNMLIANLKGRWEQWEIQWCGVDTVEGSGGPICAWKMILILIHGIQ